MRYNAKDKKKILLLTQYFYPDITAASFRMYELYKYLINNGFRIEVVTTFPHRSNNKIVEDPPSIHRIKAHFASPKNKLRYIYYYLEFVLKSFFVILKNRIFGCELIFVSSPPIFIAIEALFISILFRKKLFLDIRDLWPDTIVDLGKIKKNGITYKFLKFFERNLYKKADKVFCVSQLMKEYISVYKSDVAVVYNGVSENDFLKFRDKPVALHNSSALNVFYAGNIGMAQAIDFVFVVAEQLQKENNLDIVFHIVGEGVKLKDYQEIVERKSLKNVVFHKSLPREELLDYIYENADVLLLPLKEGFAFNRTIPSKLFDYLLLKKPIIYHLKGEGKEILEQSKCGVYFELSSESFYRAIRTVQENYSNLLLSAFENNFNILKDFLREKQFKKIEKILLTFL